MLSADKIFVSIAERCRIDAPFRIADDGVVVIDQLPAYATPERVKLLVYPGGHMFYSRDASRQAFRAEAQALMK